jgi:two-component system NarL family response regulator
MTIRLYLVCDHLLFRNGLTRLLRREADVQVVGECPLAPEAVERARSAEAHVVLLSVDSPHTANSTAAQRLYRELAVPVVLLLIGDDGDDALAALRLGARGVLDKHTDGTRLVNALRQAVEGEITVTPRLATRLVAEYAAIATGRKPRPGDSELSQREIDVLALLALGDTNQQIADKLCVSVHTVRAHLRSVMQKLGVKNRVQAAAYALNSGLSAIHEGSDAGAWRVRSRTG